MASFSLDDIRAAAEAKYGATEIALGPDDEGIEQTLVMVNPLRLSKEKRDRLTSIQDMLDSEEDVDQGDVLREAVRIVAKNPATARRFLEIAGDDLGILAVAFEAYTSGAQLGEASASQD